MPKVTLRWNLVGGDIRLPMECKTCNLTLSRLTAYGGNIIFLEYNNLPTLLEM